MSEHNLPKQMSDAEWGIPDPGDAGAIPVRYGHCALDASGAQTRTIAAPSRAGIKLGISGRTVGGTITVTVSAAYTEDGNTTFAITEVGQFIELVSVGPDSSGVFYWRISAQDLPISVTPTSVTAAAPAGTTGTDGWDSDADRDTAVAMINNNRTRIAEIQSILIDAGLLT